MLLILAQIALMRRNYAPVQLLQVLLSFTLGFMVDALLPSVKQLPVQDYPASWATHCWRAWSAPSVSSLS